MGRGAPRRRLPGLRQPAGGVPLPRAPPGRRRGDSGDARMLANLVDRHNHREVAGQRAPPPCCAPAPRAARLEPHAREQPPPERAAAEPSPTSRRDVLSVLAIAPEPRTAARAQHDAAPWRLHCAAAAVTRNVERRAAEIRAALRVRTLEVAPAVSEAFADSTRADRPIQGSDRQLAALESKLARLLRAPGRRVYLSMPHGARRPGAGRVRGRPRTLRVREVTQKLRGHLAAHRSIGAQAGGHRPLRAEPAPLRPGPHVGVLLASGVRGAWRTTDVGGRSGTGTIRRCAPSATAWSAICTAACAHAGSTTRRPPGGVAATETPNSPPDEGP